MYISNGAGVLAGKRQKAKEDLQEADRIRLERCAARHISFYFSDLQMPEGVDLGSKRYVDLCVESNICDAVDSAYKAMRANGRLQASCGDGTMGEDVRFVIRLLKEIRSKCIPQEFSAGILLMHLELVEGLSF